MEIQTVKHMPWIIDGTFVEELRHFVVKAAIELFQEAYPLPLFWSQFLIQ